MRTLRNLLTLIGLLTVAAIVAVVMKFGSSLLALKDFDPKALAVYGEMMQSLLATGNAADATVWKAPVKEGLSVEDVEQAIELVANERNIKNVGALPLSRQVELETGKPVRFLKIYMFCNPQTAVRMVDYSDAFSAYLPCRLSLVEDKQKQLWIYTLNMDMMIHGGKPLPDELRTEAIEVKDIILDVLKRGASGDW